MNHAAFLAAIRADPDDDVTRLVYADWLDENGQADRAEFIRTQVALARLDEDDPDRPVLEDRERELLAAHEGRWLGPLPSSVLEWSFRGGCVDRLVFQGREGLEGTEDVLARHPVRELVFGPGLPPESVARSPLLADISALDIGAILPATFTRALAGSSHLSGLSSLALRGHIGDRFFEAFRGTGRASRLKVLALESPALSDACVGRLLSNPHLPHLAELNLEGYHLSGSLLAEIVGPEHGRRWSSLTWHNRMNESYGRSSIARLENAVNLRRLSLSLPEQSLLTFPCLPELTDLELRHVAHAQSLYRLAASGCLPQLRRLVLSLSRFDEWIQSALVSVLWGLSRPALCLRGHFLSDRDIQALGRAGEPARRLAAVGLAGELSVAAVQTVANFTQLEDLDVQLPSSQNGAVLGPLLRSPSLSRLRRLSLTLPADQASVCLSALSESPHLQRLRELRYQCWSEGPHGVAALAEWPGLSRLDVLVLGSHLNDAMLRPLAESPYLSPLTRLTLTGNALSGKLASAFRARLGRRFSC